MGAEDSTIPRAGFNPPAAVTSGNHGVGRLKSALRDGALAPEEEHDLCFRSRLPGPRGDRQTSGRGYLVTAFSNIRPAFSFAAVAADLASAASRCA